MAEAGAPHILCVDDDRDVAEVVQAILVDEGYRVSCLYELTGDILERTVGQIEPDCVLLDGPAKSEFGAGWELAAWMAHRRRRVPVVMFTSHPMDSLEAAEGSSDRAQAAEFAAVLPKPFQIDDLLGAVATAVGRSEPFLRTNEAEEARTRDLAEALLAGGATDVDTSTRREWAAFRNPSGAILQLYWWQARGVSQVGRYTATGKLRMIGQFVDRDAAIRLALQSTAD